MHVLQPSFARACAAYFGCRLLTARASRLRVPPARPALRTLPRSLLFKQAGIFARALGDHLHFSLPLWGNIIKLMGGVDGTRENCTALMENGQNLLV